MTSEEILTKLRSQLNDPLPLPASGNTTLRHSKLWEAGLEDLSFARIAEAHWDAIAILSEAGRHAKSNALYGVWASESADQSLQLCSVDGLSTVNGAKMFCSGAGLIDYALVTVGSPQKLLVEVDVRGPKDSIQFDTSAWATPAFQNTRTGSVTFRSHPVSSDAVVGEAGWYLIRPGFWHGACGPAACWAGGAEALVQYAKASRRRDHHTLAHLGAMHASIWAMRSYLEIAAREIDTQPADGAAAHIRALTVRHIVEQHCTDVLRRFARAYGPFPLSMDESICRRYYELDLYLRQSHAERDLEALSAQLQEENGKIE